MRGCAIDYREASLTVLALGAAQVALGAVNYLIDDPWHAAAGISLGVLTIAAGAWLRFRHSGQGVPGGIPRHP